jgi:hypothetical protein
LGQNSVNFSEIGPLVIPGRCFAADPESSNLRFIQVSGFRIADQTRFAGSIRRPE